MSDESMAKYYEKLEMTDDVVFDSSASAYEAVVAAANPKPDIMSFSAVFKWDTCPRQYYYGFDLGLMPNEGADAMVTGSKGHKLLQDFYNLLREGFTKEEARKKLEGIAKKLINEDRTFDLTLLSAWTLVDNYIRENEFPFAATLVENRFLFPASLLVDDPALAEIQIGFTPDVVFERNGGFYDVEDSKFIQRAWPQKKVERFPQAKLYEIFLKRMGYKVSRSTLRFFNVKTGKISKQDYLLEPAEEVTLIRDFTTALKEVKVHRDLSDEEKKLTRRTMNYTACQFCAFEFPCDLEAKGKSAVHTLATEYSKSDYDYAR